MKHTILKYYLLLLIPGLVSIPSLQAGHSEDSDSKPSELLRQYMLNHPNENFIVQTDRDLYFSGNETWFSVWSLDDHTLCPFSYSGIVNIELMDKNGESMVQRTLKLENHKASGRIILPEQMASGTYYLQAYTNLQRNYGEQLFGIKIIQVINPSKPPDLTLKDKQGKPLVSVFPEGQRLLYDFTNKLVVKATYPNGLYSGLKEGFLIRQPNDTVAEIDFLIPGMGYCTFYADKSHTYHLDLPGIGMVPLEILDKGLSLNVQKKGGQLNLRVLGNRISDNEKLYLTGKARGKVFFEQVLFQDTEEVKFSLSSLPGGLLEFSILDSGLEQYCQRLVYNDIAPESQSSDLLFRKTSFQKGETIDLEIRLPENRDFELLSLSIRKELFINHTLNQDFKSCVDLHPFLNDWDEFAQLLPAIPAERFAGFLDLYLITKNSSRFQWQKISCDIPEKHDYIPELDSRRVTGYGFNPANSMRIRNMNLVLFVVGKEASMLSSRTDNEGRFSFEYPYHKTGISEVVIQAYGHNDPMDISFNWPYHQSFQNYRLDFFHFDSSRLDEYDKAYFHSFLEKMYRNEEKSVLKNEERIIAFYGIPDSRIYLKDYVTMRNMEEVFKEIIPGEKISVRKDQYDLQIYHRDNYALLGDNPLLLFNGAPVLDIKEVLGIPVSRIDFVDMVRQSYRIEDRIFDGIINIVAKDLNLQLRIPPNAFKTRLGVFPQEIRFSRDQGSSESRIPDLNPTLYWNPDLSLEGNTRRITLKAGDNPGKYQVLLRGIDSEGKILEIIKYITIE